jgi:cytochrome P450
MLVNQTPVSIQAWSINRDPDYFHRAASFEPERWLPEALDNASSPYHHDHRQALQPFSVGPRNCIGKHLGLAQSRLILANLVWHFDIGAVEGERLRWEELRTFLLVEKKPVKIQLKRRVL